MRDEELVSKYPRCYHLAYGPESWQSIHEHGLLSVAALLEQWEIEPQERTALLQRHRPAAVSLTHPVYGTAVLRDQRPLKVSMLERALTDMTTAQWLAQLNSFVFFAATRKRLEDLYAV